MAKTAEPQVILASVAHTTSGQTNGFPVWDAYQIDVFLEITAVSGTSPTLDFAIKSSADNSTFFEIESLPTITSTGYYTTSITENQGKYLRFDYTIGGTTPSFTFKITMIPHRG